MQDKLGIFLLNWRINAVLPHISGDLLDVGCGTNILCARYRQKKPQARAVGVDVYPWEGVDTVVSNSGSLPFENASFDTVSCIAALNHIPERDAFIMEAARMLRPEGALILTMIPPGISRIWHFVRSPWDADQHERGMVEGETFGYSLRQLADMLQKHSFRITARKRFMLGVNSVIVARPE